MTSFNQDKVILEKVAYRHRRFRTAQLGILSLTNRQLIFQPKIIIGRSPLFWISFPLILFGTLMSIAIGSVLVSRPDLAFPTLLLFLGIGIAPLVVGSALIKVAYLKRDEKIVTMDLKDITNAIHTGQGSLASAGFAGRQEKVSIKFNDPTKLEPARKRVVFPTKEGGYEERFALWNSTEFLNELNFAIHGDPTSIPSCMLCEPEINVPKFCVPEKYPGAIVPLQKNYSTPDICCMCGDKASQKSLTVSPSKSQRIKEGNTLSGPLSNLRSPYTHPFPTCSKCYKVFKRAQNAGIIGGGFGFVIGIAVLALFFVSSYFFDTVGFLANILGFFAGLGDLIALVMSLLLLVLFTSGLGWLVGKAFAKETLGLIGIPKEKKDFYRTIADNKAIKIKREPGFVAYGFLNKEFAEAFCKMNQGTNTAIDATQKK